ncbi:MAG TPA: hypothetical protein VFT65_15725 [Candidatus Angelobacter sp.]|nr:hypothetical protein [Candidatus Angelobacter sp.]
MALLLTLFALLLLSAVGLFMVVSSTTETRIDTNYGTSLRAYYSAKSGLEEVRDRISYPSTSTTAPGGLSDQLPQDVAGNPMGVLYVINPANGEAVDPTDPTSPYFDDDLCHDYASNTPKGIKCSTVPNIANWQLPSKASLAQPSGPLDFKWARINMKTNRTASPYLVDGGTSGAPLDTRVCWDGQTEQLSPRPDSPSCDANGMQTVYMVTALSATPQSNGLNAARKLVTMEVVAPSIRPAGMVTASSMTLPSTTSNTMGIPQVAIDGRVHNIDGTLANASSCSSISSMATDSGSSQLELTLNQIRKTIVDTANSACNADGTPIGSNSCTAPLWWVRGTDAATRFVTSVTNNGGSGDGDGGDHHDDHHRGVPSTCDPATPSCFTNLDLSAVELFALSASYAPHVPAVTLPANATAPFTGSLGNQADPTVYQPAGTQTLADQIAAVNKLLTASRGQTNYFSASQATLAASYGTQSAPAVVEYTDATLSLQNSASLVGYGLLVIPSALEVGSNATLKWNGIVLINSSTGHVTIGANVNGGINGALLLTSGANLNLQAFTPASTPFTLSYSCDAVDLPFHAQPFKIISTSESSY